MSDVIRLLPDHVANQIAAGEVVQRPASVVKELAENAIDAGGNSVQVIIKDAGRTLIQVADDGKGMSFMDARMAFERHATSKISSADDLFALQTKGFRGEALASIAAISHVTLKTKRKEDELGTLICIEGSEVKTHEACQCAHGSSLEVKNLFYNVPARRSFLKSDQVEFRHILDEFERVALAHPEVGFKLIHNGQEVHHLLPGPLRKRIVDIIGRNQNEKLVPVNETTDIVRIEGFIMKPEAAKKTRGDQFFFVNNRFFRDNYFNHAISAAFEQVLAPKLHPGYFLFLEIDPAQIDVNVHPTKTEIKFEEDKAIYAILRSAVMQSLGRFNIAPLLDFERETALDIPLSMRTEIPREPVIQVNPNFNPFKSHSSANSSGSSGSGSGKAFTEALNAAGFSKNSTSFEGWANEWEDHEVKPEETASAEQSRLDLNELHPKGPFILKGSFVLSPVQEGILVVHYRRAQEKLLYDELMKGFYNAPLASQQLIFPMEKTVSRQDKILWEEQEKTLRRIGFDWHWNELELQISGIPAILDESTLLPSIDKIIEQLQLGQLDKGEIAHTMISQLSFAGSMSMQLQNNNELVEDLLVRLFALPEHQFTASGKRIITHISNEYLLGLF